MEVDAELKRIGYLVFVIVPRAGKQIQSKTCIIKLVLNKQFTKFVSDKYE